MSKIENKIFHPIETRRATHAQELLDAMKDYARVSKSWRLEYGWGLGPSLHTTVKFDIEPDDSNSSLRVEVVRDCRPLSDSDRSLYKINEESIGRIPIMGKTTRVDNGKVIWTKQSKPKISDLKTYASDVRTKTAKLLTSSQ